MGLHCLPVAAIKGFKKKKKHVSNYNILYFIRLRTLDDEAFFLRVHFGEMSSVWGGNLGKS